MISSEQGASVVRRNLDIDLFNEITIKLPNIDVQNKLGKQISNLNKKIDLENDKLYKLLELKKRTYVKYVCIISKHKIAHNKCFFYDYLSFVIL